MPKLSQLPVAASALPNDLVLALRGGNQDIMVPGNTIPGNVTAAFVPYTPTFGNASNVAAKLNQTVSVIDYGADPSGVADSSTAFSNAFNSGATLVYVPPPNLGQKYIVHDVVIPSGVTVMAYGAYFQDAAGSQWMFKLKGYSSRLLGAYVSTALNCAQAVVIVENSFLGQLADLRIVNCINGIRIQATGGGNPPNTDHVQMINCWVDTFTGIGFDVGPNCSEVRAVNCYADAGLVAGAGGLIPRTATTGFRIYGTGSTYAYGGHCFTQCQASNTQDGWYLNNSNLVNLTGCIADDNSGRGFAFDGTTNLCVMTGCFTGPAYNGVWCGGASTGVWMTGLTTLNNGVIGGYGSNFYTSATIGYNGYATPAAVADIYTAGTASDITVDAATWLASQGSAHVYYETAGSRLSLTGTRLVDFSTGLTAIGSSTTNYIGPAGASTTAGLSSWVMPYNCVIQKFRVSVGNAPGAGSYTYTLFVNGLASAVTGSVTGAGVFSLEILNGTQVGLSKGNIVQLQLVTSAGTPSTFHSGYLEFLPQP